MTTPSATVGVAMDPTIRRIREESKAEKDRRQRRLREQILDIERNPTLTVEQKAQERQKLLMGRHQSSMALLDVQKMPVTDEQLSISFHNEAEGIMGCEHYARCCKLKAKCCGGIYTCRFCHDAANPGHPFNRYDTEEMYCMFCKTVQPIGQLCSNSSCGKKMAHYYCDVCKFFDDSQDKDIYHCPFCKICRVGKGLDIDYFHCHKCNACISVTLRDHKCVERSLESDCPICHQYLFTSTKLVMFMKCGHPIHVQCFEEYIKSEYTCPLCHKSLFDMTEWFSHLDEEIATHQIPDEYANVQTHILCNDCEKRSVAPFHFLYHKCTHCGSYNTVVLSHEQPNEDQ